MTENLIGWYIVSVLGLVVVIVVLALVIPILKYAYDIGKEAEMIDESLKQSVENTAGLAGLSTTIEHVQVIVAGLERGRHRLGG